MAYSKCHKFCTFSAVNHQVSTGKPPPLRLHPRKWSLRVPWTSSDPRSALSFGAAFPRKDQHDKHLRIFPQTGLNDSRSLIYLICWISLDFYSSLIVEDIKSSQVTTCRQSSPGVQQPKAMLAMLVSLKLDLSPKLWGPTLVQLCHETFF